MSPFNGIQDAIGQIIQELGQETLLQVDPPLGLGSSFDFLQDLWQEQSTGENPAIQAARASGRSSIGRATDRGARSIRENQSSSGFRGGGANIFNDLFGGQQQALGTMEAGLADQQTGYNQYAQSQLGKLNMFEGGQRTGFRDFMENRRQFNRGLEAQLRMAEMGQPGIGDFFGHIAGAGASVLPFIDW